MNEHIVKAIEMVGLTFLFVALIIPYIKKVAIHIGAMDIPDARKVHNKPMPRLGGLGIFLGFLIGYIVFGQPSSIMNSVLIGSFIIVIIGVIDDIKPIDAKTKFSGQLLAALIVVFYGNLLIERLDLFNIHLSFGLLAYPITIFFILGCINSMNLIDGLDGLASGVSSIYFLTIGIIAIIQNKFGLDFTLTFVMLGATLGFLKHNFNPASIFMGDSGSLFLGFIVSVIALLGFKNVTLTSLFIPFLILAIPILDTSFAILRRLIKGQGLSTPDKFHIHHQLLNWNLSTKKTVLLIYLINSLFAFTSIIYVLKATIIATILYIVLIVIVITFVMTTNVVVDHKKDGLLKKKSYK